MTEIICILLIILLIILLAMAYVIWSMDRLLDKEKEDYDDLMAIHQRTLKDLERKDRLLAEWEKWVNTSSTSGHPCVGCTTGWGSANSEEVHTCEETCEKLAAWIEQQKKEG